MQTNEKEIEELIEKCFIELNSAHKEKYEAEKAERTAAMFLAAQMKLSIIMADIELQARHSKNEIERVEADVYFKTKEDNIVKKLSEASLTQYMSRDPSVIAAKTNSAKSEANLKKYTFIMASLKEGHLFFRGLSKAKNGMFD